MNLVAKEGPIVNDERRGACSFDRGGRVRRARRPGDRPQPVRCLGDCGRSGDRSRDAGTGARVARGRSSRRLATTAQTRGLARRPAGSGTAIDSCGQRPRTLLGRRAIGAAGTPRSDRPRPGRRRRGPRMVTRRLRRQPSPSQLPSRASLSSALKASRSPRSSPKKQAACMLRRQAITTVSLVRRPPGASARPTCGRSDAVGRPCRSGSPQTLSPNPAAPGALRQWIVIETVLSSIPTPAVRCARRPPSPRRPSEARDRPSGRSGPRLRRPPPSRRGRRSDTGTPPQIGASAPGTPRSARTRLRRSRRTGEGSEGSAPLPVRPCALAGSETIGARVPSKSTITADDAGSSSRTSSGPKSTRLGYRCAVGIQVSAPRDEDAGDHEVVARRSGRGGRGGCPSVPASAR